MKRLFIATALLVGFAFVCLSADEISRAQYLELIRRHPSVIRNVGDVSKGEIEIITDKDKIAEIEKKHHREVGVIARDNYWIWINDACEFPSGRQGVYGRVLWTKELESDAGVCVMPITPDGKIALNCNFRHATRTWEIELPRGAINAGESIEQAAKRETAEETGMVVDNLIQLGNIPPDSGFCSTIVPIFAGEVVKEQSYRPEFSEAIEEILFLTPEAVKEAFVKGFYTRRIRGEEVEVNFRDPFFGLCPATLRAKKAAYVLNHSLTAFILALSASLT